MSLNRLQQTVEDASLLLRCESIRSNSFQTYGTNSVVTQLVTQSTSITTTVNCGLTPSSFVLLTTQSATSLPLTSQSFTFQNSLITTNSLVKATVTDRIGGLNGINGISLAQAHSVVSGACTIDLLNCGTLSLAGTFEILVEISNKV